MNWIRYFIALIFIWKFGCKLGILNMHCWTLRAMYLPCECLKLTYLNLINITHELINILPFECKKSGNIGSVFMHFKMEYFYAYVHFSSIVKNILTRHLYYTQTTGLLLPSCESEVSLSIQKLMPMILASCYTASTFISYILRWNEK